MIAALVWGLLLSSTNSDQLQKGKIDPEKLGFARMDFEDKVVYSKSDDGLEDNIYSMPLSQHVLGYYPYGRSDKRFLVYSESGWRSLLCQQLIGKHAKRIWRIELQKSSGRTPYTGTLALVLLRHGVQPKEPVPKSAKQALNKRWSLAGYGYEGPVGGDLRAWSINPDGALGTVYAYGEIKNLQLKFYPIVPEESMALGAGNYAWPPNFKTTIMK